MRKFHKVCDNELKKYVTLFTSEDITLPQRQTVYSCGYDFYLPYDIEIGPFETIKIYTGVKAEMATDEFLMISVRSSAAIRNGLILANQLGIIDSDYFSNVDNDGHIVIVMKHILDSTVVLKKGERIAQGIIMKYYTTYDDIVRKDSIRKGGLGSTDIK